MPRTPPDISPEHAARARRAYAANQAVRSALRRGDLTIAAVMREQPAGLAKRTLVEILLMAHQFGRARLCALNARAVEDGVNLAVTLERAAVERLAAAGVDVRVVGDSAALAASQFHPKLYLITTDDGLTVFAGSGNLTAGGLRDNVEQFEELHFAACSPGANVQHTRFETLWKAGTAIDEALRSGAWDDYITTSEKRRDFERSLRRQTRRARRRRRTSAVRSARMPAWIGITKQPWWDHNRTARDPRGPVFMRAAASETFHKLEPGGVFFYLVKRPGDTEPDRAIEGFSEFHDDFEKATRLESWNRYGSRVGCADQGAYVGDNPDEQLGLIMLDPIREFGRRIPLD